jgi:rare lipoprotein A (peptidoglycan hydrolase)
MGAGWRGEHVLVCRGLRCVEVILNDWCGSHDKTIDLSDEAFDYLGRLSSGVLRVSVGW